MLARSLHQSARLAFSGGGGIEVDADLDQRLPAVAIPGQEIDLKPALCADVGDFCATPLEFQQNSSLQSVSQIRLAGAVEYRDESGIDGVNLTRIYHPAPLGAGSDGDRADEEGVFQVGQVGVQSILGHGHR